ncbi:MAG: manganese-binding transcriptional regulator MntR [Armatimonadetes bacterium]|nr:manganese-binding transcriptional regulator MntR [Armatimonadota bacterium]
MTKRPTSAGFKRTRNDHACETAEDYVEAIDGMIAAHGECRVTQLADQFGVSHVTALKIVRRLERDGLTTTEVRKPIELTRKGKRLANRCRDRHDIVHRFLLAIGVSERMAAIDAEGIEHHVSPETLERMRNIAQSARP